VVATATAFILAGGASRRMAADKALLPWGGATLLDHALARLRLVTDDVRVLCGPAPRYAECGAPLVLDPAPDAGALGALLAALQATACEWLLLLAVDLPHVPPELVTFLLERALRSGHDALVPVTSRGPEPLCAAYRRTCLAPVRECVAHGELRMTAFWPRARVATLDEADLARFGSPERLFLNVNSPEDYALARRLGPSSGRRD